MRSRRTIQTTTALSVVFSHTEKTVENLWALKEANLPWMRWQLRFGLQSARHSAQNPKSSWFRPAEEKNPRQVEILKPISTTKQISIAKKWTTRFQILQISLSVMRQSQDSELTDTVCRVPFSFKLSVRPLKVLLLASISWGFSQKWTKRFQGWNLRGRPGRTGRPNRFPNSRALSLAGFSLLKIISCIHLLTNLHVYLNFAELFYLLVNKDNYKAYENFPGWIKIVEILLSWINWMDQTTDWNSGRWNLLIHWNFIWMKNLFSRIKIRIIHV